MKQFVLFTYILLTSLLFGCESETISSSTSNVVGTISTRVSNDITSLPTNSQALFHTSSGIGIFTFDGNRWNGDQSIFSFSSTTPNVLTALYPAYYGEKAITENPYTDNELEDVLIAQSSYTNEQNIELTFKHLFSTLTIHLLSPLRESITQISLEVPMIESLNADGNFSLSGTLQILPELNTEGNYTFIIPPKDNCTLTLHLTIGEETISHPITHSFKSGYKYECKVKEPGIYNAEDLIEFSKTYNKGGDLSAFGKLQNDGKWLFQLCEDIDFWGINTNELQPIGYDTEKRFNDIFDGQEHKISNINIKHSGSVTGIFGRVGQYGTVKNLHLINCSTPIILSGTSSTGVGFITGTLSGSISNCSVTSGSSTVESAASTGGLVGAAYAGSNIINCFVQNTNLKSDGYVGGIVGSITEGNITNCYSASNTLTRVSSSYSGGFCGYAASCDITNSYVYKQTLTTSTNRGQFIGYGKNSSVSYCYTNTSSPTLIGKNINETSTVSSSETYNSSTFMINELHIVNVLNQWITNNQSSYKNHTFTTWKEDTSGTLPAIFQ